MSRETQETAAAEQWRGRGGTVQQEEVGVVRGVAWNAAQNSGNELYGRKRWDILACVITTIYIPM